MLESKKPIIPVFYNVSPSVLRCEADDGPYTKALKIHGRASASEVKKWKDALHTAADWNGFKLDDYNGCDNQNSKYSFYFILLGSKLSKNPCCLN
jgi:hypothetical protein